MKSIEIELNKEKYTVKLSNRAIIKWEEINNRSFSTMTNGLNDIYNLFYCCITENNKDFEYEYTEFLDVMDDHTEEFTKFVKYFKKMTGVKDDKKKLKTTEMISNIKKSE